MNADLKPYASKYIWWKTPDEAVEYPYRVVAQVMNIGDLQDVFDLLARVGEDELRKTIHVAEAGHFMERSWTFCHHRLGLVKDNQIPPLPARRFG